MKQCKNGHDMTPDNTGTRTNGTPMCLTCRRADAKRYYQSSKGKEYRKKASQRADFKKKAAWRTRANRYGMKSAELTEFFESHGWACSACGAKWDSLAHGGGLCVDHNHTTGQVRGILCVPCNSALGQLREDEERFMRLVKYMTKYV